MKKIMKKALSLALALVMMLSLAPVTADASMGDGVSMPSTCILSGETVSVAAGETKYVEISGGYGTFDFVVEGTGAFDVAVCTEGTEELGTPYAEGSPVSAENGKVETQITLYESTYACGAFSITNKSGAEATYVCTVVFPMGSQANPETVNFTLSTPVQISVDAGAQYYINAKVPQAQTDYTLTVTGNTGFQVAAGMGGMPPSDVNGTLTTTLNDYFGMGTQIQVMNNTQSTQTYTLVLTGAASEEPSGPVLGSQENPDTLVVGSAKDINITSAAYYYTYTATVDGKLTIEMLENMCPNGWVYSVTGGQDTAFYYESESEEECPASEEYIVKAGDTIQVMFATGTYQIGTVVYKVTFTEGDFKLPTEDEDLLPEEGVTFTEQEENAALSSEVLSVGKKEYETSLYEYTLYAFAPTQTGKYTFTVENGVIGLASNNDLWVNQDLKSITSNTFTWECKDAKESEDDAGQSIWVAVKTNDGKANITVEREEIVIKEIPQTVYPASADAYTFVGDASAIEYVDVQGTTTDTAVLGDDGFYHLNDKTGPILLVNLDDSIMTFVVEGNLTIGKIPVATYDSNGEVIATTAYGAYIEACIANASSVKHPEYGDVLLYPLTDALMEVYKTYGTQQGWYNTSMGGQVITQFNNKYNPEDIWMFACMYVPNAEDGSIVVPPVAIKPDAIVDEKGNVTGYNPIKEEVVKTKIEEAVKENRDLVVETTADGVIMTFAPADLKDAKAVELNIEVALKTDVKDETVAKNDKIKAENFVLKIEFAHTGDLPATATITIPVSGDLVKDVEKLFYYEIKADGTLEFVCEAPVKDGVATVTQAHCSDYVLLTDDLRDKPEDKPEVKPEEETEDKKDETTETSTTENEAPTTTSPKTGDDTNIALWVAVLGLGVVAIAGSVVMRKREF